MAMGSEGPPSIPGRENACLGEGTINVNGLGVLRRRELVESFERGMFDVMGVQETYVKGCRVIDFVIGSESEVWEGMEGRVVWCGLNEKKQGKRKGRVCTSSITEDMTRH